MESKTLQQAVDDLYRLAVTEKKSTSTKRLAALAAHCVSELARRGLEGAVCEATLPGGGRPKDWDVAWYYYNKPRLAISLKSLLRNIPGAVPNRIDELIGETANLQMYSPEIVIGYLMIFDESEDAYSEKHGSRWGDLLHDRIAKLSGRRAPAWSPGTIEASSFIRVNFSIGPRILSGALEVEQMFDILVSEVRSRNPGIGGSADG